MPKKKHTAGGKCKVPPHESGKDASSLDERLERLRKSVESGDSPFEALVVLEYVSSSPDLIELERILMLGKSQILFLEELPDEVRQYLTATCRPFPEMAAR